MLERSPDFQPPPSPIEEIERRALHLVSNEDLQLMKLIATDVALGVRYILTERESEMLAAHGTTLDSEARQMGFRSFARARRR
jgi:hypothetical protein